MFSLRFRNRKTRSDAEEKNWSVILNPLKSELDKKRVAAKISNLFRLSLEDTRELVQSTPLILLDELSHPVAQQIEGIFQEVRAEVTLTNDPLIKRRCYRAAWPEPPRLSFLDIASSQAPETSIEQSPLPLVQEEIEKSPDPTSHFEKKYRELELLYQEANRENQELKRSLEQELKDWEEHHQSLKEEYQDSKAIYEEKLLAQAREGEVLKVRIRELEPWPPKARELEKQNQGFLEKLNHLESAKEMLDETLKERSEELNLWREKYHTLAQKVERFESLYEEEKKRREQTEQSHLQTSEKLERIRRELEIQTAETERWRIKFQELEESQKRLEQEFTLLSQEQETELRRARDANRELGVQLEVANRQARELLSRVEQQELVEKRAWLAKELAEKEGRLRELALENDRLRQEVQERESRAQTLANEQANLEREILEAKQAQRHLIEQSKMKEKNGNKLKRTVGT